jgi:hypothetical protein
LKYRIMCLFVKLSIYTQNFAQLLTVLTIRYSVWAVVQFHT